MKTNTLDFDAQALRERILDLAMRGKLVPQDPNDEPASVLLEKIKAEKEELVKEKKIKKSKALPEITDDEKLFDIPDSWEWVRLGDVSEAVTKGTTPRGGKNAYIDEGIKFYRAENIKNYSITSKPIKFISDEINKSQLKRSQLELNDLLITIAGTLGNVAVVKENNLPANVNQAIAIVRLINSSSFDEKYLSFALGNQSKEIIKRKKTTSIPNLTLQQISETIIPVPPLSEQSRIAAKIAQLFALLRKVESSTQQYAELQTLLKSKVLDLAMRGKLVEQDPHDEPASVLLKKIKAEKEQLIKEGKIKKSKPLPPITDDEKPFDIPNSWEWVRLGNVTTVGDFHSMNPQDIQDGENLIELADIESSTGKLIKQETVNGTVGSSKYRYFKGNVLFAKLRPYLKKVLLAPNTGVCTTELLPIEGINIDNHFLYYSFLSDFFFRQIEKEMHGVNLPRVSPKKLSEIIIPIPPVLEQERICNEISHLLFLLHKSKKINKRYFTNTKS